MRRETKNLPMRFRDGRLAPADSCKSGPAIPAVRSKRGIAEAGCQPRPDFLLAQIMGHRRHQLVEDVRVNLIERVVIQAGKIIAVRKLRGTFSIRAGTVEEFYHRPQHSRRRAPGSLEVSTLRTGSTYRVIHSFPSCPHTQNATRPPSRTRDARLAKPAVGSGRWCKTPTENAKSNTGRTGGFSRSPITTWALGNRRVCANATNALSPRSNETIALAP